MDYIRDAFDPIASQYDSQRRFVIPQMEEFYGAAVWAAESPVPDPAILDIGAGTGLLSALLLQRYQAAQMTLLDIAPNMLDIARKRFRDRKNLRYRVCDYSDADLGGPYDLVCSALSIHHLVTADKRRLFERIFSALSPGGLFVNADQAEGETPYFTKRYLEYWNAFLAAGPLNTEENREIRKRRESLDRNEKLSDQIAWLQNAGFSDVDLVYKNRTFIVTVARKAVPE